MELVKEEILITSYVLKVDGYKSSRKIKIKDGVYLMIPSIQFNEIEISNLNFKTGNFDFGCRRANIDKLKYAIDQLKGTGSYIDILRKKNDSSKDHDKDIIVDSTLEESSSFYIFKDKLYKKSDYDLIKNINKVPKIFTFSNGTCGRRIKYEGSEVAPESNKDLVIKKLEIIQEIFNAARKLLDMK